MEGVLNAPELVRLHTTCLLFDALCGVESPLQDTLRFILRELSRCLFKDFRPGDDVLSLTPFYVLALQAYTIVYNAHVT